MKINRNIFFLSVIVSCVLCASIFAYFLYRNPFPQPPDNPEVYGTFTPQLVWQFNAEDKVVSSPIANNSYIFVRTQNFLHALNREDGKEQWRSATIANLPLILSPILADQYLIVPEKRSGLAAFSTNTGDFIWRIPPLKLSEKFTVSGRIDSFSTNGNQVYVSRFDYSLAAYSIVDGKLLWDHHLSGRAFSYVVSDTDNVYLGAGSALKIFNAISGDLVWQKEMDGIFIGPMLLVDNVLFFSDEKNNAIYAFDVQSREFLWKKTYKEIPEYFELNCLSYYDNFLYLASDRLLAISPVDGNLLWVTDNLDRLECPTIQGDTIYIRNTNTNLYVLNRNTGATIGGMEIMMNSPMKHEPFRSPIITENLLIVPFGDNRIYAFSP